MIRTLLSFILLNICQNCTVRSYIKLKFYAIFISVPDPWHFDTDPDTWIRILDNRSGFVFLLLLADEKIWNTDFYSNTLFQLILRAVFWIRIRIKPDSPRSGTALQFQRSGTRRHEIGSKIFIFHNDSDA
jgi:hypothetical protein